METTIGINEWDDASRRGQSDGEPKGPHWTVQATAMCTWPDGISAKFETIRTLGERGTEVLTVIAAGTGATAIAACGTQAGVTPEWFVSGAGLSAACGLGVLCWVTW